MSAPLRDEHVEDLRLEIISGRHVECNANLFATRALSSRGNRVEKGAAGIRVHFDQLRSVGCDVKVVAHERAGEIKIQVGNLRCPRQALGPIRRQAGCRFNGLDHLLHLGQDTRRNKDGDVGKQRRVCFGQALRKACDTDFAIQRFRERGAVQGDAEASPI